VPQAATAATLVLYVTG